MKENVICGHLIPAGTGQRSFEKLIVYSIDDYEKRLNMKHNFVEGNGEYVEDKEDEFDY
jgi:DNA-directed RNA polymerase subunit beta'